MLVLLLLVLLVLLLVLLVVVLRVLLVRYGHGKNDGSHQWQTRTHL